MKQRMYSKIELDYLNQRAFELNNSTISKGSINNALRDLKHAKMRINNERIPISDAQRHRIYKRDGYRCTKCGSKYDLCIHHIIEVSKGGSNDDENLTTLCIFCHAEEHPDISEFMLSQWYDRMIDELS